MSQAEKEAAKVTRLPGGWVVDDQASIEIEEYGREAVQKYNVSTDGKLIYESVTNAERYDADGGKKKNYRLTIKVRIGHDPSIYYDALVFEANGKTQTISFEKLNSSPNN